MSIHRDYFFFIIKNVLVIFFYKICVYDDYSLLFEFTPRIQSLRSAAAGGRRGIGSILNKREKKTKDIIRLCLFM